MSNEEVKVTEYGLTVEFSGDVDYHLETKVTKAIEKQISDGVAAAAAKFEEDFFFPSETIGKKYNMMTEDQRNRFGLQKEAMDVRVRTAAESIETPEDNVCLYKDGDWSIARNRYLGLYILYKGQSLMFVRSEDRKNMPEVPENIRTKWKFLCEMDK